MLWRVMEEWRYSSTILQTLVVSSPLLKLSCYCFIDFRWFFIMSVVLYVIRGFVLLNIFYIILVSFHTYVNVVHFWVFCFVFVTISLFMVIVIIGYWCIIVFITCNSMSLLFIGYVSILLIKYFIVEFYVCMGEMKYHAWSNLLSVFGIYWLCSFKVVINKLLYFLCFFLYCEYYICIY
jgi:hypothetical protein